MKLCSFDSERMLVVNFFFISELFTNLLDVLTRPSSARRKFAHAWLEFLCCVTQSLCRGFTSPHSKCHASKVKSQIECGRYLTSSWDIEVFIFKKSRCI